MEIFVAIVQGALTAVFAVVGTLDLTGRGAPEENFVEVGLPGWFRFVAGTLELLAALGFLAGFWYPPTVFVSVLLVIVLALVSVYAFVAGPHRKAPRIIAPAVLLVAAVFVGYGLFYTAADRLVVLFLQPTPAPVEAFAAQTIAEFPDDAPALLESIVATADGDFYISVANQGEIRRVAPDGSWELLARLPVGDPGRKRFQGVVGTLALGLDGNIYAAVVAMDPDHRGIWQVTPEGSARLWAQLPETAQPNGLTIDSNGDIFAADSHLATIWKISAADGAVSPWLEHELFGRQVDWAAPGANGIKFWGDAAYVSNSFLGHIVRVPVEADGSAGEPGIFATGIPSDDIAFDVQGNLYVTTHVFNSVVRFTPTGERTVVATADQQVVGPTDVAFGVTDADRDQLYVINDGGYVVPKRGAVPNIVKLDVGIDGLPIP